MNTGKADVRYWRSAVFKPTFTRDGRTEQIEHWAARIQWRGRREVFNLGTPIRAIAATMARDIYFSIVGAGWGVAIAKFKPMAARPKVKRNRKEIEADYKHRNRDTIRRKARKYYTKTGARLRREREASRKASMKFLQLMAATSKISNYAKNQKPKP